MEFVGKTVRKEVKGVGFISGTVKSYDPSSGFFEIVYEDGDSEELESSEVASLLQFQPESVKAKPRVGRKPKKRRRVEQKPDAGSRSGNVSENLVEDGSDFRGDLDGNVSSAGGGDLDLGCAGIDRAIDVDVGNGGNSIVNVNGSVKENGGGEDIGFEDSLNKSVDANGSCVKDALDLNARLNLNEDFNLNDACTLPLDTEDGFNRRDCIDLNLDVNNEDDVGVNVGYLGCSGGEVLQRECNFDLNVEACEEGRETRCDDDGNGHSEVGDALFSRMGQLQKEEEVNVNNSSEENEGVNGNLNHVSDAVKLEGIHVSAAHAAKDGSLCLVEENGGDDGKDVAAIDSHQISNAISVRDSDSVEAQRVDWPSEGGVAVIHELQDDPGSPCKQGNGRRKRRKVSDNPQATPETVLRRSSRRASARKRVSSTILVEVTDDPLMSLETSALTGEKPLISNSQKYEQCSDPLPKLQLPPSSTNLNLDGVPVLELFSIYACLRSFSTLLFLSPFELEDLVAALKSEIPSILFDSIHVSILQTLRKNLEYLSNEGCQSASNCLRYIYFNFSLVNGHTTILVNLFDHVILISSPFLYFYSNAGILAGIFWTWSHGLFSWPSTF